MRSLGRLAFIFISATVGTALASAYFAGGSFYFDRDIVAPPSPNRYYSLWLGASHGCLTGHFYRDASGMGLTRSGYPAKISDWHTHASVYCEGPGPLSALELWEPVSISTRHKALFGYSISVPIWPFALACWLPLILWLRKKPWIRDRVGFPMAAAAR